MTKSFRCADTVVRDVVQKTQRIICYEVDICPLLQGKNNPMERDFTNLERFLIVMLVLQFVVIIFQKLGLA